MNASVKWAKNVHDYATKVQTLMKQVLSEKNPTKKYILSVEYDRLLDEAAKHKLNMTAVIETAGGSVKVVWDEQDNTMTETPDGEFMGYI